MSTTRRLRRPRAVPLPKLSDAAAVEIYLYVEHLMHLVESRYANQIRRHFQSRDRHNLLDSDCGPTNGELPF